MNDFLNLVRIVAITLIQVLFAFASAANPSAPTNLRIIDNFEQLGVDVPHPRFAWHVNDTNRAAIQTAYRIIVAESESNIDKNTGDMCDTKRVMSSAQSGVSYSGTLLRSCTEYLVEGRDLG